MPVQFARFYCWRFSGNLYVTKFQLAITFIYGVSVQTMYAIARMHKIVYTIFVTVNCTMSWLTTWLNAIAWASRLLHVDTTFFTQPYTVHTYVSPRVICSTSPCSFMLTTWSSLVATSGSSAWNLHWSRNYHMTGNVLCGWSLNCVMTWQAHIEQWQ